MSEGTGTGAGTAPGVMPEGVIPYPPAPPTVSPPVPSGNSGAGSPGPAGPVEPVAPSGTGDDPAAQLAHWKEMARKNEARAKDNAAKAAQFDALQESQKTDLQKLTERAEKAEKAAADALTERLRISVGAKYQLTQDLLPFLTAATEAEIEDQAKRLADAMNSRNGNGNGQPQRPPVQRPIESLRPGSAPSTSSASPQNPDQVFRGMIRRS